MKDNIDDIDFSFGKYSSTSLHQEYDDFLRFSDYVESLPAEVKRSKNITGRRKNYKNISTLFSSFRNSDGKNATLFRRGTSFDENLINSWLSFVYEKEAFICSMLNVPQYTPITNDVLSEFTKNSINENFPLVAPKVLLELGIILLYEESIPSAKVDGVVYVNDHGNPVIGMSLRFSRIDNYWFTLMHELSHVLLHYDQLGSPIIDDTEREFDPEDLVEAQADRMALDLLIPRSMWRGCAAKRSLREDDLFSFSKEVGIHPAIVAGRIRKETGSYKIFSKIVNQINIREMVF
ncbi:TPA: ImmA/IrrE family metallo-endopeptidase [Klebsiella pneumoniae]|uniref:ImmA/IrrE family metallo-endopeptidase n=1 Tax=Enterobacteriaceae TaxID=543 RepID=UPI0006697153|nr:MULTISPECIES: ImmA/IrrE family metallo-endopeptidase [Enterobacteriaceae]EIW5040690.1 ImmA/IrrE family metallo-endopeptidase [Klebsiella pneumoniae]MBC4038268.1 ImmA/IrrE family metallo-endopeptidase [Klebsiella pneumoniae]MBK2361966.1 ImmA/IrrE family metallo-endopeptidase [Klebsiella pneumoniae]MDK1977236.1 ImmA/IrrE family metallo-endopeptidase [Klebsiella sp. K4-154]WDU74583.1 ImmA/IrrE family metallo-endopeptidase [Klebsiella pneumoniae]